MPVASSLCAGLVAPDVAAHMREASAVAQLGDVPCRLARLMGTREPLEVVGAYDVIGHSPESRAVSPGAVMSPRAGCRSDPRTALRPRRMPNDRPRSRRTRPGRA